MNMDASRIYEFTNKLANDVRVAGTPAEERAAQMILSEIHAMGGEGEILDFKIADGEVSEATLAVLEPYQQQYTVSGYLRSLNTPDEGSELEFLYAENALPANLADAKGKLVLINGYLTMAMYRKLQKAQVGGILTYSGTYMDDESKTDLDIRKLRPWITERDGFTIALNMRAKYAQEMVRRGASNVRVTIKNQNCTKVSHNVEAIIHGERYADELICLGAHYDTVMFAKGAYDNASGSAILLELYRYFLAHKPKRTLRFCWYGGEEQGLLGSHNYVDTHAELLKDCRMMFNIDLAGTVMGKNFAIVTGEDALRGYVDALYQQAGEPVEVTQDIYSSDCMPFVDIGIPCINMGRFGAQGQCMGHDRYDTMEYISAKSLDDSYRMALLPIEQLVNAAIFPFERTIPADIREKADKYLGKTE